MGEATTAACWAFILSVVTSPPNLWHFNYVSYPLAVPGPACELTLSSSSGERGWLLWSGSWGSLKSEQGVRLADLLPRPAPPCLSIPRKGRSWEGSNSQAFSLAPLVLCMTQSIFTPFEWQSLPKGGVTGLLLCFMANSASAGLCRAELSLGRGTGIAQA